MPADYSEDVAGAFIAIEEAGGPVKFNLPVEDGQPADPALPWEGSDDAPATFDHIAAFVPLGDGVNNQDPFAEQAIIPAQGLPLKVEQGTVITKANGEIVSVVRVIAIAPDGLTTIIYICEVTPWPGT